MFAMHQIGEKKKETMSTSALLDMEKAFDRINREDIWKVLRWRRTAEILINHIQIIYKKTLNYVKTRQEISKIFEVTMGLRQECILSFTLVLDKAKKKTRREIKPQDPTPYGFISELYILENQKDGNNRSVLFRRYDRYSQR